MLIFLFIFALVRTPQGAPTFDPLDIPMLAVESRVLSLQRLTFGTRSTSDIVLSSLATVFACTWTAIHPNIPGPTDSGWTIFKRNMVTMVYALLAPECIVFWALDQHFAANHFVEDYNKEISKHPQIQVSFIKQVWKTVIGWFRTPVLTPKLKEGQVRSWSAAHGFFLVMGGFMLCDKGQPVQVLDYKRLVDLIKRKEIDAPMTTEAEIKDRSKGDTFSKTVVMLQTTWFIVQCISRWSAKLPVTELEQVTLGFALLNGITYGVWWNKPQNVRVPVYVEWKGQSVSGEGSNAGKESTEAKHIPQKRSYLTRMLAKDRKRHSGSQFWTFDVAYRLIQAMVHPLYRLTEDDDPISEGALRVPMFYSPIVAESDDPIIIMTSCFISTLFGLVHLIPSWLPRFPSPSPTETTIWQACSIITTVEPILLAALPMLDNKIPDNYIIIPIILAFIGLPLYLVARFVLMCLALTSLRALPTAAHLTMDWVSFLPHI